MPNGHVEHEGDRVRVLGKIGALLYLVAAVVVTGVACGLGVAPAMGAIAEPFTRRLTLMLEHMPARIALAACAAVLVLGVLITVIKAFLARRPPDAVHPAGDPDIQVTCAALTSIARAAAEAEGVMVESVKARVAGKDRSQIRFTIEAIAFIDHDLARYAAYIQERVQAACERMLGATGVTVSVRFLPSKTTIVTKEVSRDRA